MWVWAVKDDHTGLVMTSSHLLQFQGPAADITFHGLAPSEACQEPQYKAAGYSEN